MIIIHLDPKDQNINSALNINLFNYTEEEQDDLIYELTKYITVEEIQRQWPDFGKKINIYKGVIK